MKNVTDKAAAEYADKFAADTAHGRSLRAAFVAGAEFALERAGKAILPKDTWFQSTHGLGGTRVYAAWRSMKDRCLNPSHRSYKDYGGRGITVCERWLTSFENFYADMGDKPVGLTLERRDNEQGYSPENCYWASAKEQGRNRRTNHKVTHNGTTRTFSAWAEIAGISPQALRARLRGGWTFEQALTLPLDSVKMKRNEKGQYTCPQPKTI